MSILTRPLTFADLCQMPNDGNRYEIIDGGLLVSPAPSQKHQRLSGRLHLVVGPHVETRGLGEVYYAPVDVRLGPNDIVQPDLLFIRRDRLDIYRDNPVEGPPDLVIEILSPANRSVDLVHKAALYARAGVRGYWIADPEEPSVRIFVLRDGRYEEILPENGFLRSTVLPDLVIDLAALFANLD